MVQPYWLLKELAKPQEATEVTQHHPETLAEPQTPVGFLMLCTKERNGQRGGAAP